MKITDRTIQNLKPKNAKRTIYWKDNGNGFGVRVSEKGKKSFIYMYRFNYRARMMTLGHYPKLSLADANIKHSEAVKKLEHGIDPALEKVEENILERNTPTIKILVDEYIERWAKK